MVGGRREWRKIVLELTAVLQEEEEEEEGHEYGEERKKIKSTRIRHVPTYTA